MTSYVKIYVWNRRQLFCLYMYSIYLVILSILYGGIKIELLNTNTCIPIALRLPCSTMMLPCLNFATTNSYLVKCTRIDFLSKLINKIDIWLQRYNRVQADAWRNKTIFTCRMRSTLRMQSIKCVIMKLNVLHRLKNILFLFFLPYFNKQTLHRHAC